MLIQKKNNFFDEMRKKLNAFHLQKLKLFQSKEEYQDLHQKQNIAKDVLIQIDDEDEGISFQKLSQQQLSEINGWKSNRINKYDGKKSYRKKARISSNRGFDLWNKNRVKSPKIKESLQNEPSAKKSHPKTSITRRKQKFQKQHLALTNSKYTPIHTISAIKPLLNQKQERKNPLRQKTQPSGTNAQNKSLKALMSNVNYERIKRKTSHQKQLDLSRQKQILQQLIQASKLRNRCSTGRTIISSKLQVRKKKIII